MTQLESEVAEVFGKGETPLVLETLRDTKRVLAKIIRQIHFGTLDHKRGMVLIGGLGTLAKIQEAEQDREIITHLQKIERTKVLRSTVTSTANVLKSLSPPQDSGGH